MNTRAFIFIIFCFIATSWCQAAAILPRSADSNTVLLFGAPWMHKGGMTTCYGGLQGALEYQQTFNSGTLARCLLGQEILSFKGSQVADRTPCDLIADYFGLPITYEGTLCFAPYIRQINLHAVGYWGFDRWVPGLYAKLDITFSHQWRTLGVAQDTLTTGTTADFFPLGYMGPEAASTAPNICTALGGNFLFGDMQTPWDFGRFRFNSQSATGIAGLSLNVGYDFLSNPAYFFGPFFRFTAPTGTRVHQHNIFDAVVGNGQHWEVGGGISAGWQLLHRKKHDACMLFDGYVTTLLANHQLRSCDLTSSGTTGSCLSRYTLLKQLTGSTSDYSYAGALIPAINFTTRKVNVSVAVKGDATLRLIYTYNNRFAFTCGYNIYGNTQEKISCVQEACGLPGIFARKGCQGTDYLSYTLSNTTVSPITITSGPSLTPLNSSASGATAYTCGTGIDNPVAVPGGPAQTGTLIVTWNSNNNNTSLSVGDNITPFTSQDPVILTDADLNLCSAGAPRQLTNKGFIMLDYLWNEHWLQPYVGIGTEIEGNTGSCQVNQWGIFLKGGLSY